MKKKANGAKATCLIVHARTAWYAFVNPESPEVGLNNCPIKLWLGGTSASQHPAPLLHSLMLVLVSSLARTNTQALIIHKQKWTRCAALPSQEATNPWIIAGMISSQRASEEMVKSSSRESFKEADGCTRLSWLFIDVQSSWPVSSFCFLVWYRGHVR